MTAGSGRGAPLGVRRTLAVAVLAMIAFAGCSSSADEPSTAESTGEGETVAVDTSETTTTTAPPVVQGLASELGLRPGQCFAEIPETTTTTEATTTTVAPTTDPDDSTTGSSEESTTTASVESAPITTTIPRPRTLAVVECAGTREGVVYAALCLGSLLDEGMVPAQPADMGAVVCPGDVDMPWPGDRLLRRSAARVCLEIFEEVYGEPYALSEVGATELVPSRGVWELGDRRVVCTADQLAP